MCVLKYAVLYLAQSSTSDVTSHDLKDSSSSQDQTVQLEQVLKFILESFWRHESAWMEFVQMDSCPPLQKVQWAKCHLWPLTGGL